jgi:K+-sensing histidine kinase KdpD
MALAAELPMQQADIQYQLSLLYTKNKQFDKSIEHAKRAIVLAKKHEMLELLVNALETLGENYETTNNYLEAFNTIKEYNVYKDSLQSYAQKKDVELLEADYKVEKSAIEIDKLELLNQKNTLQKSIYLILFISFLIIAILLYSSLKKRNALNEMLEKSNKVKDRLLSIIAHDLKSPLNNIVNVLEAIDQEVFTKEEQTDEEAAALEEKKRRAEFVEAIRQNLLKSVEDSQRDWSRVLKRP